MTDLDDLLAKLSPATQARWHRGSEIRLERLPVPSVGLNNALNGGIGLGRQTMLWGNKSAGKSTFCLELIKTAQEMGLTCGYIDAERTFEPVWAERLGVDTSKLGVWHVSTIPQMADMGGELVDNGLGLLVIDSINALAPTSWMVSKDEDNEEIKRFDDSKQIGQFSKDIGQASVRLNMNNERTAIIWISHTTTDLSGYHASQKPTGGNKFLHMNSTVIKLWGVNSDDKQLRDGPKTSPPIGRPVNWTVMYNKLAPPGRIGTYNFYFEGDFIGIDRVNEIVGVAVMVGVMEGGKGWITYDGKSWREKELTKLLREDQGVYDKLMAELELRINGTLP